MIECPQELAWRQGEAETVALMGTINLAVARLVSTIRMLIDTDGWGGHGIQSVEHWVTWKAGVSRRRAENLVRIGRRIDELPACWALFSAGRLTEDAMVLIARRVPAERDAAAPEFKVCLAAARDAEFRDHQGLEPDADLDETPGGRGRTGVTWVDALVRMASEAADALDPTLARTGYRGERNKVVLHHDVGPDGSLGPAQLHLGPVVADTVARYLACDAEVMVAAYKAGQLIGITPTVRAETHRRRLRRRGQAAQGVLLLPRLRSGR